MGRATHHQSARVDDADVPASRLTRARPGLLPAHPQPQLATLVEKAPPGDGWLHEAKYDGYRLLCVLSDGTVRLLTRRGHDWTSRFPTVARALAELPVREAVVDGELVALDAAGRPDFQMLQNALTGARSASLVYYAFDLPFCDGYDLVRTPLIERKALLESLIAAVEGRAGVLRFSDHTLGHGAVVHQQACRMELEGIVSKRVDSPYEGRRTESWLKTKCAQRQEFVIGGYTDAGGSRQSFGALLLGYYAVDGRLLYCGRVGTGFNDLTLVQVLKALKSRARQEPAFDNPPNARGDKNIHWVEPSVVAEVQFMGFTDDGVLRHPSFKGLRQDREAKSVRLELPARQAPSGLPVLNARAAATSVARVALSHADKVVYPDAGITKHDLALYYEAVAEFMLPHVVARPLTLVRCPEGSAKPCFHQKHLRDVQAAGLKGVTLKQDGDEAFVTVRDATGLIALVQMGVLEIHPWGSRVDKPDKPDRLIFDLDPGPGVAWPSVVEATWHVRLRLANLGLDSYVKTTGGKGLHVTVPLQRRVTWDDAKAFARGLAKELAQRQPDRFTADMSKARRHGRIFVDYLRNGRGATAVAPYSTRARAGAPVAVPLEWDELDASLDPMEFTVRTVPARLIRLGYDPWQPLLEASQSLTKSMMASLLT